jgi:hypothetical protein
MKPALCRLLVSALAIPAALSVPSATVPDLIRGSFVDDYEVRHVISDSLWILGFRDRYHIVVSSDSARYLIAWNDSANTSDPGKWTRIDWMVLPMPPYEWAFCLIEYQAGSRALAEASTGADRDHPRTGCNGFPFSRMRRASPDSSSRPY